MEIKKILNEIQRKNIESFTFSEIDEIIKDLPEIDMDKFSEKLSNVPVYVSYGEMVISYNDLEVIIEESMC